MTRKRIELIDALRGLAVILMVIHHALYDAVTFLGAPQVFFFNPVFNFLHYVFAGLFILLSGVSSRFSHSNIKRGLRVIAIALAITLVTYLIGMPDYFGILHLLGFCMVFYGLTWKFWERLPRVSAPIVYIALLVLSALAVTYIKTDMSFLWMFGWTYPGFFSSDYFPIFPWVFLFLLGTWAGKYIIENRLPGWFYDTKVPVLPAVGRKALLIYVLHQPVLYGIAMLIAWLQQA
jgi:uncharacterized membrane protein